MVLSENVAIFNSNLAQTVLRFQYFLYPYSYYSSSSFRFYLLNCRLSFCICTEMAFQMERDILFQTFLCSLLSILMTSHALVTDIYCLKSIKDFLEDPLNSFSSSWNLDNNTEGFICRFDGVECWHPDENRVLNIDLSNMGLKGQFPRGLQNCSSLVGINLSLNELSGPIPSDISRLLKFSTSIDLSNNKFSGEIPKALANCTYLNALKLDNNMLSGQIPQEFGLLPRIKTISFANNHLSGPVPQLLEVSADVYANNSGLCGGPLEPCSSLENSTKFFESFKDGVVVGYVFSVTCVIVVCISYSYCAPCDQLKKKKKNHPNKAKELSKYICSITRRKIQRVANQMHELLPLQLVEKGSKEISVLLESLTSTIRFEELHDATDCFAMDNAIGVGKMGIMYKGRLPNGQFLAVKRLLLDSQLFNRQFVSEIMIQGKYRHRNIMPLLGFCMERNEKILVYQYMSNGRLSKWLHPLESEVMRLKWPERVNIALGIARGLSWLHHSCNLQIVHLNICSECILLDDNLEPKISNFGEAKFMNPNTEDNLGMMFKVNDGKKDVYDFGSVLFELITGKTYNELSRSFSTTNLCGNPSNFYNAIDKSLAGEGFVNEVCTLFKVACECVRPLPDQRPTVLEVYNNMSNIWKGRHGLNDEFDTPCGSEIVCVTSIDEIVEL
ncbi:probably inactive leucine-rich repeat receptor-like protein kinase At5g48380 isoform X1 [Gastrolobium bilobum]|uniref:probably inactive leucine-rich repeat receptor-like protein kinase At5g48380 isoform X1 n=1 Tax=Gastrolobium bilobum TaxID=150636 RepID=UPI002AB1F299|nr:probably inactive leucine-rich repeat receptor-like protein kinase At5g48380 isoform X1 [Gastrolobium bilobum]